MHLYRLLSRLFPDSFTAKAALIAAAGTQAPFLALIGLGLLGTGPVVPLPTFVMLAGITLAATCMSLLGLRKLLRPLEATAAHLDAWDEGWHPGHLPSEFGDELGRIMRQANRLMDQASVRLGRVSAGTDIDPLTGAMNRSGLVTALTEGGPGWLLQFGIDGYDTISERWGPYMAEEALRAVTRVARATLRPGDILARLEDDVFAVLLPPVAPEGVRNVAERLQRAMEGQVRTRSGPVTISVGLAMHGGGADTAMPLARAEEAMAQARQLGRNRVFEAPALVQAA